MVIASITPKQFLGLLSRQEVVGIMTSAHPDVIYFRTLFLASERVRGDDAELPLGLALLSQLNLISTETLQGIRSRMNLLSA